MSKTRTINPTIPPPVPACHGSADCAVMGAASASMNSESWRRRDRAKWNILAVSVEYYGTARTVVNSEYCFAGREENRVHKQCCRLKP